MDILNKNSKKCLAWIGKHRWFIALIVLIIMIAPLPAAAATNTEIIAILDASIKGLVTLVKLAYCAAGISALC